MDDELEKISNEESLKANFIPESPLEEMMAGILGVQYVLDARESSKQERIEESKSMRSKKAWDIFSKLVAVYVIVGILAVITRLFWLWLT